MQPSLSKPVYVAHAEKILLVLCLGAIIGSSLLIPSLGTSRYASPDETAVAQTVTAMVRTGSASIPEPLALEYPWLHSRSWVSQGERIVPVGFLGWPVFLLPWRVLLGESYLGWAGWLVLVSACYPFFRLLRERFSERSAWIGTLIMVASPAMILYANRSLFPNVGLVAIALWSFWLIRTSYQKPALAWLAGVACGVALMIRPIEAIWLVPWWIVCVKRDETKNYKKQRNHFFLASLAVVGVLLILNAYTYGHWWQVGYWLKDNLIKNTNSVLLEKAQPSLSFSSFFPFGIHPRSILWNLRAFGTEFLWPSASVLLSGVFVYLKERRKKKEQEPLWKSFLFPAFWMTGVLVVIYGSGLYRDHVQVGAVTVGNSFLRYLLPLAPLTGFAAAFLAEKYATRSLATGALLVGYVVFGIYAAVGKDDEGIWKTRQELKRYATVQEAARTYFAPQSVIVSERSDKIFAPYFRGVSPLPPMEEVAALVRDKKAGVQVGLYARPLSQVDRDAWRRQGVELLDRGTFAREHLYQLVPR